MGDYKGDIINELSYDTYEFGVFVSHCESHVWDKIVAAMSRSASRL